MDLAHIQAVKDEFSENEENGTWGKMYHRIRIESAYDLSCSIAISSKNNDKNRYKDVLPYDHSRIVLEDCGTDYINASLVEVPQVNRRYILSQGPLPHTTPHFWLLIWQQNCKGIVMLNRVMEKNQIKCHQYWPLGTKRGGHDSIEFSSVNLKVDLVKDVKHSHYIYRTFRLTNTSTKESREVLHFHYTTWPDFGVPQSPEAFCEYLNVVRASGCLEPSVGPAVIHCSAGIGRSGTFCLADCILLMLDGGLCNEKNGFITKVLLEMRRHRMGLIQTPDQLRFSFQAIIYGAENPHVVNGKDISEGSGSSEEPSLEEPPPLPPPRIDSLTSRSSLSSDFSTNYESDKIELTNHDSDTFELTNHDSDTDADLNEIEDIKNNGQRTESESNGTLNKSHEPDNHCHSSGKTETSDASNPAKRRRLSKCDSADPPKSGNVKEDRENKNRNTL